VLLAGDAVVVPTRSCSLANHSPDALIALAMLSLADLCPPPTTLNKQSHDPRKRQESLFYCRAVGDQGVGLAGSAIDIASVYAWAQLHTSDGNPRGRHCAALLRQVAHELARAGRKLEQVISDNGSEFRNPDFRAAVHHHEIEHRRIRAGRRRATATQNGCS